MKQTLRTTIWQALFTLIGSFFYALSVNLFLEPNHIVTGGLTGVAILIHHYLPRVGIGLMFILMNVPLFVVSWRVVGRRFMLLSLLGMGAAAVFIDLTSWVRPVETEPLMAAMAGGLMMGAGLGLVFRQGASTGGSDVVARLIRRRRPYLRMGVIILMVDAVVIAASMLVFRSINAGLHAILAIYLSSRAVDLLLYGTDAGRVVYIISDKNDEIAEAVRQTLQRGVTYLSGEGSYTGRPRKVILCAVKRQQVPTLKKLVKEVDPQAFIILTAAHEVLGEGFDELRIES
ncbi:MAG: YitT family protein [Oscillospiraceae bacterium]|nr:YitT family protein [Oscillospiraceae bacterium]